MPNAMNAAPNARIEPGLKEALREAAGQDHRSIANMVAVMIRDDCGRNGITIQEKRALLLEEKQKPPAKTKK